MALTAGHLLFSRQRITIPNGQSTFDTGLEQTAWNFFPDPELGGLDPSYADPDGTPSRIMVVPMMPTDNWAGISIHEPYVDPATGRVFVDFENPGAEVTCNVLFWDPHARICPLNADTYRSVEDCDPPVEGQSFADISNGNI